MTARNPFEPLNNRFRSSVHPAGGEETPRGLPAPVTDKEKKGWLLGASAHSFPATRVGIGGREQSGWLIRDDVQAEGPDSIPH
jgi:hypothetical protein